MITRLKTFLLLICFMYSFSAFGNTSQPLSCKDFQGFADVKNKIISMDKTFDWNSQNCKIVETDSIFPKKNENGNMKFERGLQIFVYDSYQLKFICLPGWVCKSW